VTQDSAWPGPIRMGFRNLHLNVPIHWCAPDSANISPCGSTDDKDVIVRKHVEDVTCPRCIEVLRSLGAKNAGLKIRKRKARK
jgi:hypothetical protein